MILIHGQGLLIVFFVFFGFFVFFTFFVVCGACVAERSEATAITIAMVMLIMFLRQRIMVHGPWFLVLLALSGERREGYPPPFSWSRDFCTWSVSPPFPSSLLYRNCCSLYSNRKTILILYVRYTTYHPPSTLLPAYSQ